MISSLRGTFLSKHIKIFNCSFARLTFSISLRVSGSVGFSFNSSSGFGTMKRNTQLIAINQSVSFTQALLQFHTITLQLKAQVLPTNSFHLPLPAFKAFGEKVLLNPNNGNLECFNKCFNWNFKIHITQNQCGCTAVEH